MHMHHNLEGASTASSTVSMTAPSSSTSSAFLSSTSPVSPTLISGHHVQPSSSSTAGPSTQKMYNQDKTIIASILADHSSQLPKSMLIEDHIHGDHTIEEPVLIDLLLSPPIQRLRHVLQHGITALVGLTPSPPVTRYAHSVGAMLLVRAAGGTVEAQASALLHDVAHTALSHVADTAFGYVVHEDDKMEYLETTTVPEILRRHGFDPEVVLEEHNYPLLELDAPAICADRIDYILRDAHAFRLLSDEDARKTSADLVASKEGTFCFNSVESATKLAEVCMQADEFAWSNSNHSLLYQYAADAIKLAHETGEMKKRELWEAEGDEAFWRKMTESGNSEIRRLANRVKKTTRVEEISESEFDKSRGDRYKERTKVRTIDPDVLQSDGSVKQLSQLNEEYRLKREAYMERKSGEHWYRVIEE